MKAKFIWFFAGICLLSFNAYAQSDKEDSYVMPIGGKTKDYVGDESYLKFPNDKFDINKQGIIIKTDDGEKIYKVYYYNQNGELIRICMPQKKTILFISEHNDEPNYNYGFLKNDKEYSIWGVRGGSFNDFDLYSSSSMGGYNINFDYVVNQTKESLSNLKAAITEYIEISGTILAEDEFNFPVTLDHPLMKMTGMKLEYFLDGFGGRLIYKKEEGRLGFRAFSPNENIKYEEGYLGSFPLKMVLGYIIAFITICFVIPGIAVIYVFRRIFIKKRKSSIK